LVVQVWHRFPVNLPVKDRQYGVSVIYSDDHGKTWEEGGYVPTSAEFPVNESRLVEMGGELVMNGRLASTGTFTRIQSNSKDGGLTWSSPYLTTLLPFSSVDAGVTIVRQGNKKESLLITRPIDTRSRKDLAVSISEDGGKTWPITKMIYEGPANYSDIVVLPDQTLFVLYGRGTPRYAASARFSMDWIKEQ
jgi:Neuraminidase (sialidase)